MLQQQENNTLRIIIGEESLVFDIHDAMITTDTELRFIPHTIFLLARLSREGDRFIFTNFGVGESIHSVIRDLTKPLENYRYFLTNVPTNNDDFLNAISFISHIHANQKEEA